MGVEIGELIGERFWWKMRSFGNSLRVVNLICAKDSMTKRVELPRVPVHNWPSIFKILLDI